MYHLIRILLCCLLPSLLGLQLAFGQVKTWSQEQENLYSSDWLITPSRQKAEVCSNDHGRNLILSNGLLKENSGYSLIWPASALRI